MKSRLIIRHNDHFSLRGFVDKVADGVRDITKVTNSPIVLLVKKAQGKAATLDLKSGAGQKLEASKTGQVFGDSIRIATSPLTNAISSVRGMPVNNGYVTKLGKGIGNTHDLGNRVINSASKGFANAITLGLASKATNLVRAKENKEYNFKFSEMKNGQTSGIKSLDKVGTIAPTIGAIGGAAYGAYVSAGKLGDTVGTLGSLGGGSAIAGNSSKDISNVKPTNTVIGPNVLNTTSPSPTDKPLGSPTTYLTDGLPAGVQPGDIPNQNLSGSTNATAGIDNMKLPMWVIIAIVIGGALLLLSTKSTS